jgi:hypothetical protein
MCFLNSYTHVFWQVTYIRPVVTVYVNITVVQKEEYDFDRNTLVSDYSGECTSSPRLSCCQMSSVVLHTCWQYTVWGYSEKPPV